MLQVQEVLPAALPDRHVEVSQEFLVLLDMTQHEADVRPVRRYNPIVIAPEEIVANDDDEDNFEDTQFSDHVRPPSPHESTQHPQSSSTPDGSPGTTGRGFGFDSTHLHRVPSDDDPSLWEDLHFG